MSTTIRDRLLAAGFEADSIEAIQRQCVGTEFDPLLTRTRRARFCASAGTGYLQGLCGGTIIAGFTADSASRRQVYLVVDDTEGETWDVRRRAGEAMGHGPRPHAVLKLVCAG